MDESINVTDGVNINLEDEATVEQVDEVDAFVARMQAEAAEVATEHLAQNAQEIDGVDIDPDLNAPEERKPYLQIPKYLSASQADLNYHEFTIEDKKTGQPKELVAMKMPGGTKVEDLEGNLQDVSFYRMVTTPNCVYESYADNDHLAVYTPLENSKGEDYVIKLTKQDGHKDENGNFVVTETSSIETRAKNLVDALNDRLQTSLFRGNYIHLPEFFANGAPTTRVIEADEGDNRRVVATLPKGTFIVVDGQEVDLSYHEFWTTEKSIRPNKFHEGYISVFTPQANKDGEPWVVSCRKAEYEKQDDGSYEMVSESIHEVPATQLSAVTAARCEEIRTQAAQYQNRETHRHPTFKEQMESARAAANEKDQSKTEKEHAKSDPVK